MDKHTSLICPVITDEEKKFYKIDTWQRGNLIKRVFLNDGETK